jgi:hypothetical protein
MTAVSAVFIRRMSRILRARANARRARRENFRRSVCLVARRVGRELRPTTTGALPLPRRTLLILAHRTQRRDSRKGVLFGVAAGLLLTVSHVAVKAATGNVDAGVLHAAPFILVAPAAGACAFFASARSLQIGEGVAVIAVTSIASNASSIPAGIVVFDDPLGKGATTIALRCLAFLLVVVAATLIPAPIRARESRARPTEAVVR